MFLSLKDLQAQNIIFYGPPGTGKTYLCNKIAKLFFHTTKEKLPADSLLAEITTSLSWEETIALILLQNNFQASADEIHNSPIFSAKVNIESASYQLPLTNTLLFSYTEATKTFVLSNNWKKLSKNLEEAANILTGEAIKIPCYEFITFHQSYGYEEFIEGIRPTLIGNSQHQGLGYELKNGVFKKLCTRARLAPDTNFALFIDEINRGNISKIFGEAISLIEVSKRKDNEDELIIRLPYSQESFSIPSNIYLIGTMNIADKSLALLDTALRRRFSFHEVYPSPLLLEKTTITKGENTVHLDKILSSINSRLEALLDNDHTIGHAFFMGQEWEEPSVYQLEHTFRHKIIPLLKEYFLDDWDKIRTVLGDNQKSSQDLAFITKKKLTEEIELSESLYSVPTQYSFSINTDALSDLNAYLGIYAPN